MTFLSSLLRPSATVLSRAFSREWRNHFYAPPPPGMSLFCMAFGHAPKYCRCQLCPRLQDADQQFFPLLKNKPELSTDFRRERGKCPYSVRVLAVVIGFKSKNMGKSS